MTRLELMDKAYLIATGNYLTKQLNYSEYEYISEEDFESLLCEEVENWGASHVSSSVETLAESVIEEFTT